MGNFDFENYDLIGCVDILPNGNANIEALGYINHCNDFHILTSGERMEMFPPKGRVFAHNFIQRYNLLVTILMLIFGTNQVLYMSLVIAFIQLKYRSAMMGRIILQFSKRMI